MAKITFGKGLDSKPSKDYLYDAKSYQDYINGIEFELQGKATSTKVSYVFDTGTTMSFTGKNLKIDSESIDGLSGTITRFVMKDKSGNTIIDVDGTSASFKSFIGDLLSDRFMSALMKGNDVIQGTNGSQQIFGMTGNDKIFGNGGHDNLYGYLGNDQLNGGAGNDFLNGWDGRDTLKGGTGNDILYGGKGADNLTGGAGKDMFDFYSTKESGVKKGTLDIITDFERGKDKVYLLDMDANTKAKGDQNFKFIGTDEFNKKAGELRYEVKNGDSRIEGDVNGDGKADFAIQVNDIQKFIASDFIL